MMGHCDVTVASTARHSFYGAAVSYPQNATLFFVGGGGCGSGSWLHSRALLLTVSSQLTYSSLINISNNNIRYLKSATTIVMKLIEAKAKACGIPSISGKDCKHICSMRAQKGYSPLPVLYILPLLVSYNAVETPTSVV